MCLLLCDELSKRNTWRDTSQNRYATRVRKYVGIYTNDKVENQGFTYYNLYVDNAIHIPEMSDTANEIKKLMGCVVETQFE